MTADGLKIIVGLGFGTAKIIKGRNIETKMVFGQVIDDGGSDNEAGIDLIDIVFELVIADGKLADIQACSDSDLELVIGGGQE